METSIVSETPSGFDEARLFELKRSHSGYRYCPRCKTNLEERQMDGKSRMACPDKTCGFVFYQNPSPAAGAIIVEDDAILLVKRSHFPHIDWWCIPAGFMEWDEHPSETAIREIFEETGLKIELTELYEVYAGDDDPRTNALLILYLARIVGGEMKAGDDASDVRFFPFENLPDKIAFVAHRQALADYNKRFRKRS